MIFLSVTMRDKQLKVYHTQMNNVILFSALPRDSAGIPWFKHYRPRVIEEHALAFRKVAENADKLDE
ncbi:hypothetical protein ACFL6S_02420 [Candidatus Poribacteria bacterium]